MSSRRWYCIGLIALAQGCREPARPEEPRDRVDLRDAARFIQTGCTKVWSGGSGNWSSVTAWSPWGVPGPSDVACILAPSGTMVTVQSTVDIPELVIGNGLNDVRVVCNAGTGSVRPVRLWVRTAATLDVRNCVGWGTLQSELVDVEGTLRVGAVPISPDSLVVSGVLELTGATATSSWLQLHGTSEVQVTGSSLLYLNGGGHGIFSDVTGTGSVTVRGASAGSVLYGGGSAPVRAAGTAAGIKFQDVQLTLMNSPQGSVDFEVALPGSSITGTPRAGLDLRLHGQDSVRWNGGVQTNEGTVTVYAPRFTGRAIVNRGVLAFAPSATRLDLDSLVNEPAGQVQVNGTLSFNRWGGVWRNAGQTTVSAAGELRIEGATFVADGAAAHTGTLRLTNSALLTGAGVVGDVTIDSGHVSPGTLQQPRATLSVGRLSMGPGATALLDVAGDSAGTYDGLTVRGNLQAGGTLDVRTIAPFLGGRCGQVIPLIKVLGSRSGNWLRTTGLSLASDRAWRLAGQASGWWLTGADPQRALGTSVSSLALAEGGSAGVVYQCLGRRPTATVTV
ncbi:MAG: hypothetical protein JNL26_15655, partial [Gemmatimonadetes bacterium]|nr:hypothetical protein [Gemmatimonadota bacterium]